MFIYFWEREREHVRAGEGQRERETKDPKWALPWGQRAPPQDLTSQTGRSWPEPKSDAQPTELPLSYPGAPIRMLKLKKNKKHMFYRLVVHTPKNIQARTQNRHAQKSIRKKILSSPTLTTPRSPPCPHGGFISSKIASSALFTLLSPWGGGKYPHAFPTWSIIL